MTALCGGGTSQPKPGITGTITFDGTAVAAFLALSGFAAAAEVLAPLIAGTVLVVENICASDPPPDPNLTSQDILNALQFTNPIVSIPAIQRIQNWFIHQYWCQVCTCTSGQTPNCGPISNPGSVTQNPGLPAGANQPCFQQSYTLDFGTNTQTFLPAHDTTAQILPVTGSPISIQGVICNTVTNVNVWPMPAGITALDMTSTTLELDPAVAAASHACISFTTYNSVSQTSTNYVLLQVGNNPPKVDHLRPGLAGAWVSGATHWGINWLFGQVPGSGVHEIGRFDATTSCSGNALEPACCPPDPNITQKLNEIYGLLYSIYHSQSKHYTKSTVHTGITGTGSFAISGLFGMAVTLTGGVPTTPELPGVPPYEWSVGWMSVLTGDGMIDEIRLTRQNQVWGPALFPAGVTFGYQLNAGFTATFTELVPS